MTLTLEKKSTYELKVKLPWHKSLIFKIAITVGIILLASSVISLYFGIQSIDSISRFTYDKDVEKSLSTSLDHIKKQFSLQQKLILSRLSSLYANKEIPGNMEAMYSILSEILVDTDLELEKIKVEKFQKNYDSSQPPEDLIYWQDRNNLIFLNFNISFPKGKLYEDFKHLESIKHRYQVIGTELEKNIRPTLIKVNSLILLISFLFLFSIFYIFAMRLKKDIRVVLRGFITWSTDDNNHRITIPLPGELGTISDQFNLMADEVEKNRKRNMHLEKIASWQVIARKLAHEIKNPLTPIQMMVSQLTRRYKGDDEKFAHLLEEAKTIVTEEVAALRRMVDNFSDFAKLPSPRFEPKDLCQSASHIIELEKAAYPQHEFRVSCPSKKLVADIDDSLLKQVFKNLIKNAAEACINPALIQIKLDDLGEQVLIQIEDNGPGIPPEDLNRVFEAYFTTKHTGPSPGMGLGLAICQKIILDHNGNMNVKSQEGSYTIFEITIPKSQES